ncbi:ribosome hibernation promoting factor [Thorsellia anophelis]|uniref:Ribosome hibernation promoting factor n=1 Tax=Thorsellia anophelis DSM 18579 TaxID=1123402 RepID=A0A1I0A9K2_9GAMM|nr:ribosome hibernation promoting factor [Thorsellia anophelis]SES90880.1 SSU ribosomal protein S30P/sigma 54 modulation protein [Thorsellia anophelis DSM 18579]
MQISIVGHHIEITPAINEFVDTKFTKLTQYFDRINQAQIVLHIEGVKKIAETTLFVNGGEIHAKAEHDSDMYAAMDLLLDKLARQLTKHKEKMRNH